MQDHLHTGYYDSPVLRSLRYTLCLAEGELDAIKFIWDHHDNISQINEEIHSKDVMLSNPPYYLEDSLLPEYSTRVYQESYLHTLRKISNIILNINQSDIPLSEFPPELRHQSLLAGGRQDALRFAWECSGNTDELQSKIQETQDLINEGMENNPEGSMSSSASPRIYREGYISGLKESLMIVMEIQHRGHSLPNISAPKWFNWKVRTSLQQGAFLTEGNKLSEGIKDAFQFALDCEGDILRLHSEIKRTEYIIKNPPESLKEAMLPGARSRVYKDNYLKGLREAIELISALQNTAPQDLT